jgi:hypothetical protein
VPRFYFHVFDGAPCIDEEGVELADLAAARQAAVAGARSIMGHDLFDGKLPLQGSISVADASGEIVDWITFRDALGDEALQRISPAPDPTSAALRKVETSVRAVCSRGLVEKWSLQGLLQRPPLSGAGAGAIGLLAVALPTLIRLAVDGAVSRTIFSAYLPFVLLSAVLLPARAVIAVVLCSAIVADFLFMNPYFSLAVGAEDMFAIGLFLVTSGMVIIGIRSVRRLAKQSWSGASLA